MLSNFIKIFFPSDILINQYALSPEYIAMYTHRVSLEIDPDYKEFIKFSFVSHKKDF